MTKTLLEIAGGTAAILAAIGYISIRAYLNHLGAPDPGSFPAALYLFETYTFLTAAAATLLIPCAAILSISTALWGSLRLLRGRLLSFSWIRRWIPNLVAVLLVISPVATVLLCFLLLPGFEQTEILLKPLSTLSNPAPKTGLFLVPLLSTFTLAFLGTSARLGAYSRLALGTTLSAAGRIGCVLSALIMLWCSVVTFNVYVRPNRFPVTVLLGKNETEITCGLAVLSTDDSLVLWRVPTLQPDSRGHFSIVRTSNAKEIEIGRRIQIDEILSESVFHRCSRMGWIQLGGVTA